MKSDGNSQQGFSLLETIVALVILALSLATLFEAYGGGMRAISAGNRYGEARLLAQSLLAQVAEPTKRATLNGSTAGLDWQLVVKPATGDLAEPTAKADWLLFEAVATVHWRPGRSIVLRSLRLGPAK